MLSKVTVAFLVVFVTVVSYIEMHPQACTGLRWHHCGKAKITVSMLQ